MGGKRRGWAWEGEAARGAREARSVKWYWDRSPTADILEWENGMPKSTRDTGKP